MRNFRNYDFWQDSKGLTKEVYVLLKSFPKEEQYALCDQIRRAVVSIPSNIAEGAGRESEADFAHFLDIAIGSCFEVETQLDIALDLGYIVEVQHRNVISQLQSVERRISGFISRLRRR